MMTLRRPKRETGTFVFVLLILGFMGCSLGDPIAVESNKKQGAEDPPDPSKQWRSALYPINWSPSVPDSEGRFLQDFSYAGYHHGERGIPQVPPRATVDVTQSPYLADNTGVEDATSSIQRAIDDVGNGGGGVVYMPAGTYRVRPASEKKAALFIHHNGVVLRGAGVSQTFVFNDSVEMREKDVIRVSPNLTVNEDWRGSSDVGIRLREDVMLPTRTLKLNSVEGLQAQDWIVVRNDATEEFIRDHNMMGLWTSEGLGGVVFYRQIESVNTADNAITLDSPTRYYLLRRDAARIYKYKKHLEEVGLEDFSIGMRQVNPSQLKDGDYEKPGTLSYKIHQAHAIVVNHTVNGWIVRVNSYRPIVNTGDYHVLSNGIQLVSAKNITVSDCVWKNALYQGEGGNGYHFIQQGNDNLMIRLSAEKGRHNYDFSGLESSGNVIYKSLSADARLPSDFHMYLSPSNLIDNMTVDRDYISAVYRDTATPKHGHGSTQSVIWNTKGLEPKNPFNKNFSVESEQFGWGYVVGTQGKTSRIQVYGEHHTEPVDWVEGEGLGATLEPASLYEDQLRRRLTR